MLVLPAQQRLVQPQSAIQLDPSHPLASSASLIYVGSSAYRTIVPAKNTTKTGTANKTGAKGVATGFSSTDGVGSTDSIVVSKSDNCPTKRTYFAIVKVSSANSSGALGRIFDKRTGADVQVELLYADQPTTPTVNAFNFGGFFSTAGSWNSPVGSVTPDIWQTVAVTYDRSSTSNAPIFYIDGVKVATTTSAAPSGSSSNNTSNYVIGNRTTDNARTFNGKIACLYFFDKILTATEIASLTANPWQIFQPDRRAIYYNFNHATARVPFVKANGATDNIALTTDAKVRFNNAAGYYDPINALSV